MYKPNKVGMNMEFYGYVRPNGEVGTRNYVLVIPSCRVCNIIANRIVSYTVGTKAVITTGEVCRHSKDRKRLSDIYVGLAKNANVYATIILSLKRNNGYPEVKAEKLKERIDESNKPCTIIYLDDCGTQDRLVEEGIAKVREYVRQASVMKRQKAPLSALQIGVKCGWSDATSGISGNPAFGKAADLLVDAGGTVLFSETTELIGAEDQVAARCVNTNDAKRLLEMVAQNEAAAKATGEDIRTINPIPANIAAGITTLEEKSLGAVRKAGSRPIVGVLEYCQRPTKKGLHFMDGWASAFSLPVSLAAAGCTVTLYQLGGGDLPNDPPMLGTNTAIVSPLMYVTGNYITAKKAQRSIDFSSGGILTGECSLDEAGQALFDKIISVASGEYAKGETVRYQDQIEPYFLGPVF